MKYRKSGARHLVRMMLALVVLINLVALPGYPFLAAQQSSPKSGQDQPKPDNHAPEQRGRIAFASDRDGDFEIYLMDPDGGGQRRLTDDPSEDTSPAWSPDGERIAFVSFRDGNAEIYVMDAEGGNPTRLTNNPAADLDPAWSPDGTRIAFTSSRDNTEEVYVMNADGTNQRNLTNNREGDDAHPAWSPNGAMIAFVSDRDENSEIYAMNADGSNQRNLTNNPATDSDPAWSPMRITFQSDRDSDLRTAPETNFEIYTINGADGGNPTRLTNSADNLETVVNESFDTSPARSSDGSRVVFASTRDGDFEIYATGADGSGTTKLTDNNEANDIEPAVQPQGTAATEGSVQFSVANFTVNEGAGSATITVTRTGSTGEGAIVDFAVTSGTASERSDFISTFRTLRFAAGETSQTVTILIIDDGFAELDETLNLTLGSPTGTVLGIQSNATLTITDNDIVASSTNPIDDPRFFVRQQYLDLLAREPDQPGFEFWVNELNSAINRCPTAPADARARCVLDARVRISEAFFVSIEFQGTGNFITILYRQAFGRLPTFREFLTDLQDVRQGVVIGQPGASELLEANQRRFAIDFSNRVAFQTRYGRTSNADFINALFNNAGVDPNTEAATRDALIAGLNNGTESRATALLRVGDTRAVFNRLFNEAFVLMEYFGYLRREPDQAGFNFWLDRLNSVSVVGEDVRNADVAIRRLRRAQIVEAFVNSGEYRRRFGRE